MPARMLTTLLVAGAAVLTACGGGTERPSAASWEPMWDDARELVPDAEAFADDPVARCGELLGEVRRQREELTPTPNEVIDDAFTDWVDDADDLRTRLRDLEALGDLVDLALSGES